MNKSQRLISLIEKSKYVQRLPQDFTIFLELNAPVDYEGMDDQAEVALAVEAEWERPDVSAGWQGGWTINQVVIHKDFKFMGMLYKAESVFPIGLIDYAPKFSKITDDKKKREAFQSWIEDEVAAEAERRGEVRKGGM